MSRFRFAGAAIAALGFFCTAHSLAAQSRTSGLLGMGISKPAGVFAAYADRGIDLTAAIERRLGSGHFALRLDASYARNADTTGVGFAEVTGIVTVMTNVVYHFDGARPHLYVLAGMGVFGRHFHSADPDDPTINDAQFGMQVGEGIVFRLKGARVFLEGRFVSAGGQQPLQFFPVIAGVRFGGS